MKVKNTMRPYEVIAKRLLQHPGYKVIEFFRKILVKLLVKMNLKL